MTALRPDVRVAAVKDDPNRLAVFVADEHGRPVDTLGFATRHSSHGRWRVVVRGFAVRHCYRRRSAIRLLHRLGRCADGIRRARLDTYRHLFDDRMSVGRGWR